VTEIPEHLLRRSKERRQGGGDSGGDAPAAASAESTSVVPAAAAKPARVEPTAPPPPKPEPPYIAAARRRARIPFWALPVLVALPVWAFIYMEAMSPVKQAPTGPLAAGAVVFSTCAACHGAGGEGGTGYKLNQGEVLKTFPTIEAQILFVSNGSPAKGTPYGDKNRAGGQRISGALTAVMPAWKQEFSIAQIVGAVCHERYVIAGADPNDAKWSKDYAAWCVDNNAPQYVAAETDGAKVLAALTAAAAGA
jgi:mono/diheme cytochrome c family protein